jgi:hypothetical protein
VSTTGGKLPPLNLATATQDERDKLLIQLQRQASQWSPVERLASTLGAGAYVTLWALTVPLGISYVWAEVIGNGSTGGAVYEMVVGVRNLAGVVTVVGATGQITFIREDQAAMDSKWDLTGAVLSIQVRDDGTVPMNWKAIVSTASMV